MSAIRKPPDEHKENFTNSPVDIATDLDYCSSIDCIILHTLNKDKGEGHKPSIIVKSSAAQYPFEMYP